MSLLIALLAAPLSWAQDEGEPLSRRQAKAAYADSQAAMYHLPEQGTLTWTLRTTLPGPDGAEMPPCLAVQLDLRSREWDSQIICQDPDAVAMVEGREAVLLEEVIGLMFVWHDAPLKLKRGDSAWRSGGEVIYAMVDESSGEFLHTDAITGRPLYSQSARGLTVAFEFQETPDGALLQFAENRFLDGAVEFGMDMEHRLMAPGVWWLSHATLLQGELYLGELWFDDLSYVP